VRWVELKEKAKREDRRKQKLKGKKQMIEIKRITSKYDGGQLYIDGEAVDQSIAPVLIREDESSFSITARDTEIRRL
jgi:hypothetical protein